MRLSELQNGEEGVIVRIKGRGAFRKRITEMGFVRNKTVKVIRNAPLNDPIEYEVMGYKVMLRRNEASMVEIITPAEAENLPQANYNGVFTNEWFEKSVKEKVKEINVVLVGNPNCGKTTFFNFASDSNEKTGNYSGVTVDTHHAEFRHKGYLFKITDLPGTYSLSAYSPEELYVRNYILENYPDVVINVLDSSNLERNLFLTTQLIDMDVSLVVALNMYDELERSGAKFDYQALGKMLGFPIVPTTSSKGIGITDVFDKVINVYTNKEKISRHIHVNYGEAIESGICRIQSTIWENKTITDQLSSRFIALKLLEKDKDAPRLIQNAPNCNEIIAETGIAVKKIEADFHEDSETAISNARYGFIAGALRETFEQGPPDRRNVSSVIDAFLTHKYYGYPIFVIFIFLMFYFTFTLGKYPVSWLELIIAGIGDLATSILPNGIIQDLLVKGIIDGVGGVLVFLPNILLLFLFISLMEDTGYMARAVFLTDKMMHKIGLHGRSFIPLIMGFGCNVPAIMATRTIENRNSRLVTMLMIPFMSCSARLPVYILVISAVFPHFPGLVLFGIYLTGVIIAILMAFLLRKALLRKKELPFVMELPPYRMPTARSIFKHMWFKSSSYLKKMGGVIMIASVIIWALGYFPRNKEMQNKQQHEFATVEKQYTRLLSAETDSTDALHRKILSSKRDSTLQALTTTYESAHMEQSYIGKLGKSMLPVMQPLGFDWKISVSLLSGFAAKEVVVSSMSVLYQANDEKEGLISKIQNEKYVSGKNTGQNIFSIPVALAFLIFVLIYSPCISTITALKVESGSWKWALMSFGWSTILAWTMAFLAYHFASLF
jgi:ferrous iron transport protein B